MCHSHNDYWRPHPLFSALAVGCASVEADVWLSADGEDILVGHDKGSLSSGRTLRSLYIDPLLQILDSMNRPPPHETFNSTAQARGVFVREPDTTLILFIDVKDDPVKTWPLVLRQLGPLRDMRYLSRHDRTMTSNQTFWPGPITIVGTGNIIKRRDINIVPSLEVWQQRHDAFLDAPLHLLTETGFRHSDEFYGSYQLENEFYTASAPFRKAIGSVRTGFSNQQMETLRSQLQIAKDRNLKSRLWGLPDWPISHRDYVWRILVQEGIDLLNANDIASAAMKHWESDYIRETAWMGVTISYLFFYTIGLIYYVRRFIVR
ncbi:altered inheritance of mitochondria 6 [Fusarium sporotrichioides]|uniref:Altered inheritance of mitochondria protein 6 n=1 Tax=Fusarium sporotrichioides TaxID=5514 RepID=A0A395RS08_FUSSP|nr:altered inheritance of mitochondria 6 [Fusarium sporotrichioides]